MPITWLTVFIASYIGYSYFHSKDPSSILVLAINILVFWAAAFFCLFPKWNESQKP